MINLKEDYLYSLLPSGVLSTDERGLLKALVGGYQDRICDLRAQADKLSELVNVESSLPDAGETNVLKVTFTSNHGVKVVRSLPLADETPMPADYSSVESWEAAAIEWANSEINSSSEQEDGYYSVEAVELSTDYFQSIDTSALHYLAETIGAVIYETPSAGGTTREERKRIIESYFPRLKIKGTSASFDVLSRLLGFDDAKVTPLWGRLTPREPSDVGSSENDQDFRAVPQYYPSSDEDSGYAPLDFVDGPLYSWDAGGLTVTRTDSRFYKTAVNGYNPFFNVVIASSGEVKHPGWPLLGYPKTFELAGGTPHKKASVVAVESGYNTAQVVFEAIAEGESFNGLVVEMPSSGSLKVSNWPLSSVKYRTSYFDLALTVDLDSYVDRYGDKNVGKNTDLSPADGGDPNLCADGTAVSPYRPWSQVSSGSVARVQASGVRQLDVDPLLRSHSRVSGYFEEVRPATRFTRRVLLGFSASDQAVYAAYPSRSVLFETDGVTLSGAGVATGFPLSPYSAIITIETPDGSGGYTTVIAVGERDPDQLVYKVNYLSSGFSGSYNYDDSTWDFEFDSAVAGTRVVARWTPTSTEVLRDEPSDELKSFGSLVGYQRRAEDGDPDVTEYAQAEDYPWRRGLLAGGEDVDAVSYLSMSSDESRYEVSRELAVTSSTGVSYGVVGHDSGVDNPELPIRVTFAELDDQLTRSIATAVGDSYKLYHVGLVGSVLLADPVKFCSASHCVDLVAWWALNQHPSGTAQVTDGSPIGGETKITGLGSDSRRWSDERGWVLGLADGDKLESVASRGLTSDFCISFWINPGSAAGSGVSTVFKLGSTKVVSGYIEEGVSYRVVGTGTVTYNGEVYSQDDDDISLTGFVGVDGVTTFSSDDADVIVATSQEDDYNSVPVVSADLSNTGTPELEWFVKNSSGTRVSVGAVSLSAGEFNFVTIRRDADTFYTSVGSLETAGVETSTTVSLSQFGPHDNYLAFCGASREVEVHDLRIWASPKSEDELQNFIRDYLRVETGVAYRPSYFYSRPSRAKWGLKVLPSGWVFPTDQVDVALNRVELVAGSSTTIYSVLGRTPIVPGSIVVSAGTSVAQDNGTGSITPSLHVTSGTIDYSTGSLSVVLSSGTSARVGYSSVFSGWNSDDLLRIVRYRASGEYTGEERFRRVGIGGGQFLSSGSYQLGNQFNDTSSGSVVVSTQHGAVFGYNQAWGSTAENYIVRVTGSFTDYGGTTSLVSSGTSAPPWPVRVEAENPVATSIYIQGDNGLVFEVTMSKEAGEPVLEAELVARRRSEGELALVEDLTSDQRASLRKQEILSAAATEVSVSGFGKLSVREVVGDLCSWPRVSIDTSAAGAPEPDLYLAKVALKFSEVGDLNVGERVVLRVSSTTAGISVGDYFGEVYSVSQGSEGEYTVVAEFEGFSTGSFEEGDSEEYIGSDGWSLYRAENEVYSAVGTKTRPDAYLYANKDLIYSVSGTQVYHAWDDPTYEVSDRSYASRSDAGVISFTNSGSIDPGTYELEVDSGNIGRADPRFSGFSTLVSLGDNTQQATLGVSSARVNPRGKTTLSFSVADQIVDPWTLSFDWTNDYDNEAKGYSRNLAIYAYKLRKIESSVYRLDTSGSLLHREESPRKFSLSRYVEVLSNTAVAGPSNNLSGVTYSEKTSTLFAVRNVPSPTLGDPGAVYEYSLNGSLLRTITFANTSFKDAEAIVWMYDDTFAISEENLGVGVESRITVIDIVAGQTTLDRANGTTYDTGYAYGNLGVEGLTYNPSAGLLYFVTENSSNGNYTTGEWVVNTMDPNTGDVGVLLDILPLGQQGYIQDVSDLVYLKSTGRILILSQASKKIVDVDFEGNVHATMSVSQFSQPEGITVGPDDEYMHVVGEPREYRKFKRLLGPGGWVLPLTSSGSQADAYHESEIVRNSGESGDSYQIPLPISTLLTATTANRSEDVILLSPGPNGYVSPSTGAYSAPSISSVSVS